MKYAAYIEIFAWFVVVVVFFFVRFMQNYTFKNFDMNNDGLVIVYFDFQSHFSFCFFFNTQILLSFCLKPVCK